MTSVTDLKKRKKYLEKTIKDMEKILLHSPEGFLRISHSKNYIGYYHRTDPKDSSGHYIRKGNIKLASDLAQKAYAQKVICIAKKEINQIDALLKYHSVEKIEQIYDHLDPSRQNLIHPILAPDHEYVKSWLSVPYKTKSFTPDSPEYYTARNIRVRSKSEILIADSLDRLNIPYRYECPLILEGIGTIYPDFTVLNVRLRKEIIWEHFGMMDDPDYARNALKKLETYELNNYLPGDSLIITQESESSPINTKIIQKMIRTFLV